MRTRESRIFHKKGLSVINGIHFVDNMGCNHFPVCFACPHPDCIYLSSNSSQRRGWNKPFPPCMRIEYCRECSKMNCLERIQEAENAEKLRASNLCEN